MKTLRSHSHSNAANEEKFSWCDYYDDLYNFYHLDECDLISATTTSKGHNKNIDFDMRKNVIDWLIHTHHELKLMPETLYLCVNILDRFLSKTTFEAKTKKEFELAGVTSLLLASKYEQQKALSVHRLEYITQYSCSSNEICEMENVILHKLNWVLTVPTPYVFLLRNIRACGEDKMMENMVFFFSELSLTHYPIMCGYRPSIIAASAVYCARFVVGRYPFWSKNLKMCTGYSQKNFWSCAQAMLELCRVTYKEGKMNVFRKFLSQNHRIFSNCMFSNSIFSKNVW